MKAVAPIFRALGISILISAPAVAGNGFAPMTGRWATWLVLAIGIIIGAGGITWWRGNR